jgi:hypothetical protein
MPVLCLTSLTAVRDLPAPATSWCLENTSHSVHTLRQEQGFLHGGIVSLVAGNNVA